MYKRALNLLVWYVLAITSSFSINMKRFTFDSRILKIFGDSEVNVPFSGSQKPAAEKEFLV